MAGVILSKRGKEKYVHNGFIYNFDRRSRTDGELNFWRCERKNRCRARLHTKAGNVVLEVNDHSHEASATRIEVARFKTILRKRAAETQESPNAIVGECLTAVPKSSRSAIPDMSCLRKIIRRKRNSMNTSSKLTDSQQRNQRKSDKIDTSLPKVDKKDVDTKNDLKKQHLEYLEAQRLQAEVQKRQAELAEAKRLAEKLAEEERLRKEAENRIYKYMVLNHEKKILETLRALWKGNQFCDATLQNECISIPVHKILLIACCPKILETYDYIMKDTNVQVCFPRKVTAEALKSFVDYLYNGSLNLSKSILDSMEYLSGMLGLEDIRHLCNQFRSDLLSDSICPADTTIINVSNPHNPSHHQMSYNNTIIPPPLPIVRPSVHNTAASTAVPIQLASNYQDASHVQSNNYNLFPEPHSNSVLTEVSHIKLEPDVDLTIDECTEIKQESISNEIYGIDTNSKFPQWSVPTATLEPHLSPPQTTFGHPKKPNRNNFEMSTTVDLSRAPLNSFQKQTPKNITSDISPGVITISPSNSPCPSPRLKESPPDVHTLQISNTHTITSNTNPFPVSLISAANGQSISLTDQENKRKHNGDFDSSHEKKRTKYS